MCFGFIAILRFLSFFCAISGAWFGPWLEAQTPPADAAPANVQGWPAITRETRPWTFNWWLGSAVDEANLGRELDRCREAGLGGIHIVPIYGAKDAAARGIPFLSPEWWRMFDWTVAAAERRDLGVDLTAGTGWCFGGPNVTEEEGGKRLVLINTAFPADGRITPPKGFDSIRWQSFAAVSSTGARKDLRSLVRGDGGLGWMPPGPVDGWTIVAVGVQSTGLKVKRAGPGGEGLMIDPLSPAAMEHYLTPFRAAFSAGSGHARPRAIYHDSYEYYDAVWSPALADEFFQRRGYRVEDHWDLLAGLGEAEAVGRLWHDYRQTVSDVTVERVFPLWTDWAAESGLRTRFQAHGAPANLLDLYALAAIPETEMFGHGGPDPLDSRFDVHIGGADRDLQVSKFASSAAHVTGRRLVSAETGTWIAEHFHETFEELKSFTDRLFIAGVNHVFYHGKAYSPDDVPWPGWLFYAASELNTRNPLWREFAALNTYVTRVQSVLQAAAPDNDFLLYWPIDDVWSDPRPGVALLTVHNRNWVPALGYELFARGHAFDYASDRQIAGLRIREGGGVGLEGGAAYRTVLFPASKTLPLETLRAALRLAEDGATIGFVTPVADDVPGLGQVERRRNDLRDLLPDFAHADLMEVRELRRGRGRLLLGPVEKVLAQAGILPEPAVSAHPGLLLLCKTEGGAPAYFMVNHALEPLDAWVELGRPAAAASVLDPLTGAIAPAGIRQNAAGRPEVRLRLEPGHSLWLRTRCERDRAASVDDLGRMATNARPGRTLFTLDGSWRVQFIAGGPELPDPWEPAGLVSWTEGGDARREAFAGTARYVTHFSPGELTPGECYLELGEVFHVARVRLNGTDLGVTFMRPHRVVVPAGLLRSSGNELEIEVTNLAANRIRDLDRRGVTWRNFYFVNIRYRDFQAADWPLATSGLLGPVQLRAMEKLTN